MTVPERRWAIALAAWAFAYACYRAYYAFGGQIGMIGVPASESQLRAINLVGALLILAAAVLPLVLWKVPGLHRTVPVFGWIGAVGCVMHALVDVVLRVLSVTGFHPTELPASTWVSFDRRAADLQDLLLNEPWFLVEGLLWGVFAYGLVSAGRRRAWLTSALVACAALTAFGITSGVGVLPTFHLG